MNNELHYLKKFYLAFLAGLTLLMGISLFRTIHNENKAALSYAEVEANASYNLDLLYRRWASMHGGVYAPISDTTPPNPYLKYIEERDIETPSGKKLTLVNPAYMIRQVFDIADGQYGIKGHITSLKPIRPENKPDEWEAKALSIFEKENTQEYKSLELINNVEYLRYMKAMLVEESCMKCHGHQAYKVGEIRGGISVSIPFEKYQLIASKSNNTNILWYTLIYIVVVIISSFGYTKYKAIILDRYKQQDKIKEKTKLLIQAEEIARIGNWKLKLPSRKFTFSDQVYQIFEINKNDKYIVIDQFINFIHPLDKEDALQKTQKAVRAYQNYETDFRIITHNGNLKYLRAIGKINKLPDNSLEVIGTLQDISQRVLAEKAMKRSEEKFRTLAETSLDAIFSFNTKGKFTFMNQAGANLCGYTLNESSQLSVLDVLPANTYKNESEVTNQITSLTKSSGEMNLINKSGDILSVYFSLVPIINKEKVVGCSGIARDISQEKRAKQELVRAKIKAEESDRLKTEFINNMSHEIRTPMNGIMGFTGFLSRPNLTENKRNQFIQVIQNSTKQLLRIVEDILEVSKLETQSIAIDKENIHVGSLLNNLYIDLTPIVRNKNIKLIYTTNTKFSELQLFTDKSKLSKILYNLLENAIKFTPHGSVEFGYEVNNKHIIFFVKDSGIGISDNFAPKIYDRFTQEAQKISNKTDGLGLGLAIANENAKLINGKLFYTSEKGLGTKFYLQLQLPEIETPTLNLHDWSTQKLSTSSDEKLKILIAEDKDINYEYLKILLESEAQNKWSILRAENGKYALEICQENPDIDLILMDLKMPEMDGYEATKLIRKILPKVPIIAQSAYSSKEDSDQALAAGCNEFISKPINEQSLIKKINHLISEKAC